MLRTRVIAVLMIVVAAALFVGAAAADPPAPQIVTGTGPGQAAEVRVFDGQGRLLYKFSPFGAFDGGISVAAGDLDADGRAEVVVGTLAAPARIRVYDGTTPQGPTLLPFGPNAGGVQVAVADVEGSGRGLIVAAEATGADPRLSLV